MPIGLAMRYHAWIVRLFLPVRRRAEVPEVRVVPALYLALVHEDAPKHATPPIDGARQPLQIIAGLDANDAPISVVVGLGQRMNQCYLGSPGCLRNAIAWGSLDLKLLIYPRDEQYISQPSLNRRDSRKELAGEGVAERAQPQFVDGAFLEQRQHTSHLFPVCAGEIKPSESRFHGSI